MATAASGRWLTRVLAVLAMGGAAYYSTPSVQADEQVVNFRCHGPVALPMLLVSLIKPDLWIILRRA